MTAVRGWKCLRCRQMQTRHDEVSDPNGGDSVFVCADGKVSKGFERFVTNPTRRTASFGPELDLLHYIVTGILAGRDISTATRHPEFGKLASIVTNMRRKSKAAAEAKDD